MTMKDFSDLLNVIFDTNTMIINGVTMVIYDLMIRPSHYLQIASIMVSIHEFRKDMMQIISTIALYMVCVLEICVRVTL